MGPARNLARENWVSRGALSETLSRLRNRRPQWHTRTCYRRSPQNSIKSPSLSCILLRGAISSSSNVFNCFLLDCGSEKPDCANNLLICIERSRAEIFNRAQISINLSRKLQQEQMQCSVLAPQWNSWINARFHRCGFDRQCIKFPQKFVRLGIESQKEMRRWGFLPRGFKDTNWWRHRFCRMLPILCNEYLDTLKVPIRLTGSSFSTSEMLSLVIRLGEGLSHQVGYQRGYDR